MTAPGNANDIGKFLRARRAGLTPEELGIVSYGSRRVPGLRREELAQLAGVSATYYTRLEQGQSTNASLSVIDSISRALNLSPDESAHLHDLARPAKAKRRAPAKPDHARPGSIRLVNAMVDVPTIVMGRRTEILAWNRLGHLLIAGHLDFEAPMRPGDRPNLLRMLFLDSHTGDLYPNWREEATLAVASLRFTAAQHQDDPELVRLIGELTLKSPEFARLWARHPVKRCVRGVKLFRHPEVGNFELGFEVLHMSDGDGQRMLTYTAEPESAAAAALKLLGAADHRALGVHHGPRAGSV